jgi:Peptidase A4 family
MTKKARSTAVVVGLAALVTLGLGSTSRSEVKVAISGTKVTHSASPNIPARATLVNIDPTSGVAPAVPDSRTPKKKPKPKPAKIVAVASSAKTLPAKGGAVVFKVKVLRAKHCLFSLRETRPQVTPFVKTKLLCSSGHVRVRSTLPSNVSTTSAAVWALNIRAKGPGGASRVAHVAVTVLKSTNVAPKPVTPTPPPTTPPSTAPAPPPPPPPTGGPNAATRLVVPHKTVTLTTASHPLPGRNAFTTSGNWGGYVASGNTASEYTGIVGEWQVPSVTSDNTKYLSEWIGIDGASDTRLIQTGTETDGNGSMYAWWEIDPLTEPQQVIVFNSTGADVPVVAGDFMYSYITQDTDNPVLWDIHLQDITQGWLFNKSFNYDGPDFSAEWVTEATSENKQYTYPANFGSMWFDNMEVQDPNHNWYVTDYGEDQRMLMYPLSSTTAWVTPDTIGTYNGYQYFYNEYTGT